MKPATAKSKGRETENKAVASLRSYGLKVERRRLAGVKDQGDIAGWNTDQGSVCVEVKSASTWAPMRWLAELDDEADNCAAETGFVLARPKGKPDPDDWVVLIRYPWFMDLMRQAGYLPPTETSAVLDRALADLRARAVTDLLLRKEAVASVALDGETQSIGIPTVAPKPVPPIPDAYRGETVAISNELLGSAGPTVTEIAERHGVTFRGAPTDGSTTKWTTP